MPASSSGDIELAFGVFLASLPPPLRNRQSTVTILLLSDCPARRRSSPHSSTFARRLSGRPAPRQADTPIRQSTNNMSTRLVL
ncbi:hypothetical protein Cni_G07376 [Canna indica]|uniref:Uncharacterized protein n=1 Tax=Canna indica TaxID=4628 RepID=A0AAQ3Q7G9_9LILI|nr:hypothetical protein Cni_G07376 [Canna indica]